MNVIWQVSGTRLIAAAIAYDIHIIWMCQAHCPVLRSSSYLIAVYSLLDREVCTPEHDIIWSNWGYCKKYSKRYWWCFYIWKHLRRKSDFNNELE